MRRPSRDELHLHFDSVARADLNGLQAKQGAVRGALGDEQYAEDWDLDALFVGLRQIYNPAFGKADVTAAGGDLDEVIEIAVGDALAQYDESERVIGEEQMRSVERAVMLQVIDARWKDHLLDMDYLQEGIHLRALGQRDPLVEYKNEGFDLFQDMLESVKISTVTTILKNSPEDLAVFTSVTLDEPLVALNYSSGDDLITETSFAGVAMAAGGYGDADTPPPNVAAQAQAGAADRRAAARAGGGAAVQQRHVDVQVGRNDPCPCGSGKKYKKCHGA
jgi:preprotein translocase subunit SecA